MTSGLAEDSADGEAPFGSSNTSSAVVEGKRNSPAPTVNMPFKCESWAREGLGSCFVLSVAIDSRPPAVFVRAPKLRTSARFGFFVNLSSIWRVSA
jgi:hypothetical protein